MLQFFSKPLDSRRLASWSFRHFSDMNVEACPGQEGGQLKGREALPGEFGAPINAGFTFHGLTPRLEVSQEGLGSPRVGMPRDGRPRQSFSSVGADKLGPVFLE